MIDLEDIRKRHVGIGGDLPVLHVLCGECSQPWPCDSVRLADEVERLDFELSLWRTKALHRVTRAEWNIFKQRYGLGLSWKTETLMVRNGYGPFEVITASDEELRGLKLVGPKRVAEIRRYVDAVVYERTWEAPSDSEGGGG